MSERWVTFDCYGTLVDWRMGFFAALNPFSGSRTEELISAYHEFERKVEAERPHRLYREVLVTSLIRAARQVGIGLSEAQARALPSAWGDLPLFGDVEAMLDGLRGMGCRLGVLTNCDDDLFAQTQLAFREPFDLVVTAERVRDYKPSTSHFRYFWRASGADREDWIHVACSWFHDLLPARDFGVRRVWFDREAGGEDPKVASVRIESAAQLGGAIAELFGDG